MDGTLDTTLDVHMGYFEGYAHKSEHPHLARALTLASQQPYAARWLLRCAVTAKEDDRLAKVGRAQDAKPQTRAGTRGHAAGRRGRFNHLARDRFGG